MLIYKIKFMLHLFCHTEFHKREEIELDFYNRLQELAKKKGKSFHQIEVDLGYSKNSFYNYKTKKPTADNLNKIAEYFGVTSDYLLGRDNDKTHDNFTKQENELVAAFRIESEDMSEEEQAEFNEAIKDMMKKAKKILNDDSKWKK